MSRRAQRAGGWGRRLAAAVALAAMAAVVAVAATASGPSPSPATGAAAAARPQVNRIRIDGAIHPAAADFVREAIARTAREGAAALLIELDTPGGLLTSTRSIVQDLLGAPVPVIVYVAPSGAGAASAGVFLVMAASIAAMAPGTNIGASAPVEGGGADIPGDMGKKVKSFTASFARAIAEQRGRNVKWAVRAVRSAASATDREALELHVIDIVASDVRDLLSQASGRTVRVAGGAERTLQVADAVVVDVEMRFAQRLFGILADPNVSYLFMLAGLLGLYLELSHPGTLVPGVIGAICLLIALASFQILPINATALALIGLGVVLLVAELFVPSFGILGIGGLVAFVLGSLFLFDRSAGIAIDRSLIAGAASAVGVVMLVLATLVARAMRRRPATGREGLIGAVAEVRTPLSPAGMVFVHGELWRARADVPIAVGEQARVVAVDGLTLRVAPTGDERSEDR